MSRGEPHDGWCAARHGERGSTTIYAVAAVLLLVVLALGVAGFGALAATKHRATAAADLAALAAASALQNACGVAADTAARNGARLVSCERGGEDVTVSVVVRARAPLGLRTSVQARSRAGPAR